MKCIYILTIWKNNNNNKNILTKNKNPMNYFNNSVNINLIKLVNIYNTNKN